MRVKFEDVIVDTTRRCMTVGGEPVSIAPRAFAVLCLLVEHAGVPVSRDQLLHAVWPDTHVVPNSVSQAIAALRSALAESRGGRCIQAVPRVGYVLAAAIEELPEVEAVVALRPSIPKTWGRTVIGALTAAGVVAGVIVVAWLGRPAHVLPKELHSETVSLIAAATDRMATRRGDDLRQAISLFSRATEHAPRDAAALAGLAQAQYLAGFYGVDDRRRSWQRSHELASMAIEIDSRLVRPRRCRIFGGRAGWRPTFRRPPRRSPTPTA